MTLVFDVHEFETDGHGIVTLYDTAGKNGFHAKISAKGLRIDLLSLVMKNGRVRYDLEIRKLREPLDDTVRNTVSQKIDLWIGIRICKWQNSDRVYGRGCAR